MADQMAMPPQRVELPGPEVPTESARALIGRFLAEAGEGWAARAADAHSETERHHLAAWIDDAHARLASGDLNGGLTLRLLRLAYALDKLRQLDVRGVEDRVKGLFASSNELFVSTVHELGTAELYTRLGHQVAFLPEEPHRTPDLLVDSEVEVECKRKMPIIDLQRESLYELLYRRTRAEVQAAGLFAGMKLAVHFKNAITRAAVRDLISRIRAILRDPHSQPVNREETEDYWYEIQLTGPTTHRPPDFYLPDEFTWGGFLRQEATIRWVDDETVDVLRSTHIVLSSEDTPTPEDIAKSLRGTLRTAARQLSGRRPGVIQVDVNSLSDRLSEDERLRVGAVADEVLRNHRSVSAVVFVYDQPHSDGPGSSPTVSTNFEVLFNKDPKHSVPEGFFLDSSQ